MKIQDRKTTFKSGGFYNLTAQIQENTLLNRGLIDLGGMAIPQMIMSNNKDERVERGFAQSLYFISAFIAPFVILPFFNKTCLSRNGIVKDFTNNERKIIEVSKKYLTKNTDYLLSGIRDTAQKLEEESAKKGKRINVRQDFENIINRFENKDELKDKLIKTHEGVLFGDFLSTALMWCATPWATITMTKLRTNRSGYSATYEMVDENQTKLNAQKYEKEKKNKLLTSALLAIVPSVIFPKLITGGLKGKLGKLGTIIKNNSQNFDYTKGIFPSKLIFAAIWLLCDYPSQIISSRDKYESRDRLIRGGANIAVFFGGDFVLNNIFGRLSDKFLKTKIMDRDELNKNVGVFKKLKLKTKSFAEIDELKHVRTKNVGAALYWATLFSNMVILGFAVPAFLNSILKRDFSKKDNKKSQDVSFEFKNQNKVFKKFKLLN